MLEMDEKDLRVIRGLLVNYLVSIDKEEEYKYFSDDVAVIRLLLKVSEELKEITMPF